MGEKLDFQHKNEGSSARRKYARKQLKRRKRKMALFYFLVVLIIMGIGVALSFTVFFKLDTITVTGSNKYTKEQIVSTSSIKMGENLFRINREKIKDKLQKQLPYIENADVEIKLPSTLLIIINEAKRAGYFTVDNKSYIISCNNKILETASETADLNIPVIDGIKLKSCNIGEYADFIDQNYANVLLEINKNLIYYKMDNITKIDITDFLNIKIEYDHRILITIGTQVDLPNKIDLTKSVLDTHISKIQKGTINVTNSKDAIFKPSS